METTTTTTERFVIRSTGQEGEVSYYAGSVGVGVRVFDEKVCRRTKLFTTRGEADAVAMLLNRDETPGVAHTVVRIVKGEKKPQPSDPGLF